MFKVGDKVVCVKMFGIPTDDMLELNKTYIVRYFYESSSSTPMIGLQNINNSFNPDRFKLLIKFRKEKIEKIRSRLEID